MTKYNIKDFKEWLNEDKTRKAGLKYWDDIIECGEYGKFHLLEALQNFNFALFGEKYEWYDYKKVYDNFVSEIEQKKKKKMTKTLILTPNISSLPIINRVDKNVTFFCKGVFYNGKDIETIILEGTHTSANVADFYLTKKSLLLFFVEGEIEEIENDILSFSNYRLKGFYNNFLSFKVLKVKEGRGNTLKIEVVENLFNSNSKTLLLPKNNEQVKKTILSKKKCWESTDKDNGGDFLETDWSEIEGETFTIENINGEKCYFENDNLVLNDFGNITKREEKMEDINDDYVDEQIEIEKIEEPFNKHQAILDKYKEELERTKQLLAEKEKLIEETKKYGQEKNKKDKENLIQELKKANQRIKELEEYSAESEQKLRELYNYAKNGSSSSSSRPPTQPNSPNLKAQLTKLQQGKQELENKLIEEQQKNKNLEAQIKSLRTQNHTSSKTVWETIEKPLLIGGAIAGGLLLLFWIYKRFVAKYFS